MVSREELRQLGKLSEEIMKLKVLKILRHKKTVCKKNRDDGHNNLTEMFVWNKIVDIFDILIDEVTDIKT